MQQVKLRIFVIFAKRTKSFPRPPDFPPQNTGAAAVVQNYVPAREQENKVKLLWSKCFFPAGFYAILNPSMTLKGRSL